MINIYKCLLLTIFIMFFVAASAQANTGLPMILVAWPALWIGLIPIIAVECFVMRKYLVQTSLWHLIGTVSASNIVSTFVGIPLVWSVLILLQLTIPGGGGFFPGHSFMFQAIASVTVQAPWLVPAEQYMHLMIPAAFLVLLIPFFFASYWIEAWVTVKILERETGLPRKSLRHSVWKANLYSYLFLATTIIVSSLVSIEGGPLLTLLIPENIPILSNTMDKIIILALWPVSLHIYWRIALMLIAAALTFLAYKSSKS